MAGQKKSRHPSIPTLSLFSGAGGLDIGFHKAGFAIKACVEIEPTYCATLARNIGKGRSLGENVTVHCEDIRRFDPTPYKKVGIECVIGGPPCQTFSAAGRRAGGVIGIADPRGRLFRAYCDILHELQPRVFVFENVYGLPGANGGRPWQAILRAFSKLGYVLRAEVLDVADYGVPQHRERLLMVGFRKGTFEFPLPTHGPDSGDGKPLVSAYDAIADLQDESKPCRRGLGGMYGHLLPLVPEGLNYSFFTAEMGHPEPVFAWRSKFHDLLYKVNRHEPCRTIKAHPGKFTGPFHWNNRHFTIEELRRLQGFPDKHEFVGTYSKMLEQIGNSVPPLLSHVVATSVRQQLFDNAATLTYPRRPSGFQSTFRQRQRERSKQFKEIAAAEIRRRYPVKPRTQSRIAHKKEHYYVQANGFFDRNKYQTKPVTLTSGEAVYDVLVDDRGKHVEISIERCHVARNIRRNARIEITGLSKYLDRIDTVSMRASIVEAKDIFRLWCVLEEALVSRSRFFTLIDIYGHYANRGDTVHISARYGLDHANPIHRALDYFSDSSKCGGFVSLDALKNVIGVRADRVKPIIDGMRSIRIDIRTDKTHPIIGAERVICTYPFPLLSSRALVESRAEMTTGALR